MPGSTAGIWICFADNDITHAAVKLRHVKANVSGQQIGRSKEIKSTGMFNKSICMIVSLKAKTAGDKGGENTFLSFVCLASIISISIVFTYYPKIMCYMYICFNEVR